MPYGRMNKCLTATEDIRIQHNYGPAAKELARTTNFNEIEVMRLLQIYYLLTTKRNRVMDKLCFAEFMDMFLGLRNGDATDTIHRHYAIRNKKYLTGPEFVILLSLLLKGSQPDKITFCFKVYTEILKSPQYIKKDDVLLMIRRNSLKMCKLVNTEDDDLNFVELLMDGLDKDRDNRISLEDYRTAVNENYAFLQFLGPILPSSNKTKLFMKIFTDRIYTNTDMAAVIQQHNQSMARKKSTMTLQSFNSSDSTLMVNNDFLSNQKSYGLNFSFFN